MIRKGDEYYATMQYGMDKYKKQIYTYDRFGNQQYLNVGIDVKREIFALKDNAIYYARNFKGEPILPIQRGKPYYAFDSDNNPIFPTDNLNNKIYGKYRDSEIYPNNGLTDIYLVNDIGDEIYARDSRGKYYFGSKNNNNQLLQFYAKNKDKENSFIYNDGIFQYPLNVTYNKPIYPRISPTKEEYIVIDNRQIYGYNSKNFVVYAQNNGDEYLAIDENKIEFYGNYKNTEFLPNLKNNRQFYKKTNNREMYPNKELNVQYYGKNENLDDIFAIADGKTYYCKEDNIEKYPQKSNLDEFYRLENGQEILSYNRGDLSCYAKKKNGQFFYPLKFVQS